MAGAVAGHVPYGYDAAGQLKTMTTPSNQTLTYGYANNQVTSVRVNGIPPQLRAQKQPACEDRQPGDRL